MADPKYAGLPGIVEDQPDIYETSEFPESEQDDLEADSVDISPSVELLHISNSEAHDRFRGNLVDSTDIDFSDRITKNRKTGYKTRSGWEIGEDGDESLVQKFHRLQSETDQLVRDVQQLKGDVNFSHGKVSVEQLSKHVEGLHSTLLGLDLKNTFGNDLLNDSHMDSDGHKNVLSLLQNYQLSTNSHENEVGNFKSDSSKLPVTYELFYGPQHAKLSQLEKAAILEKRLTELESLIGNNPEKLSILSTWTNHKSLMGAVQVLGARLALLEPAHLDHIEGRLHSVHTKMNQISEKKQGIVDSDKQTKIGDLYDLVKKSEVLCTALPEIVNRVIAIEDLHYEAAQFSHSLKQLDVVQKQLNTKLQGNGELLGMLQTKFSNNINGIGSNLTNLEERLKKLGK